MELEIFSTNEWILLRRLIVINETPENHCWFQGVQAEEQKKKKRILFESKENVVFEQIRIQ